MIFVRGRSSKNNRSKKVCRANDFAVAEWEAQMGDAGTQVVDKALDKRRPLAAVGLHEVLA